MAKKKQLPARVKTALAKVNQFTDLVIPDGFKGSTDLTHATEAHRSFELGEHAGQTISEVLDAYGRNHRIGSRIEENVNHSEKMLPAKTKQLEVVLRRDSLEEYRAMHGLDKLRDQLIAGFIDSLSFERGIEMLVELANKHPEIRDKRILDIGLGMKSRNQMTDIEIAQITFPDLTAEEVLWISICRLPKKTDKLLILRDAPFFYPITLSEIDMDGVRFAVGGIDDNLMNLEKSYFASQIVGAVGKQDLYQLLPFDHNYAQVMRAILLLTLHDQDLFHRLWKKNDNTSIRRGDAMVCKAFIQRASHDSSIDWSKSLEQLRQEDVVTRVQIDAIRKDVVAFVETKVKFIDTPIHSLLDFFRLIGMLERNPVFVESGEAFVGYVRMYGAGIDFINERGEIVDTVPLHDHIKLSAAYQFEEQTVEITRDNKVAVRIFEDLRRRAQEKIIEEEYEMYLDRLQRMFLDETRLLIPIASYVHEKKFDTTTFLARKMKSDTRILRTMKFSWKEFTKLEEVSSQLPNGALDHVASVSKFMSESHSLTALITSHEGMGEYNLQSKGIKISLPIETPIASASSMELCLELLMGGNRKKYSMQAGAIIKHELYFVHVFLHEVGESIWAHMPQEYRLIWCSYTPKEIKDGDHEQYYMTAYSKKAPNEDFCECFALFYVFGDTFRKLAKLYPAIAQKYDFVRQLWSKDQDDVCFHNQSDLPLWSLFHHPNMDLMEEHLKHTLEEEIANDVIMRDHERMFFRKDVISYEELAESIEENEYESVEEAVRYRDTFEEDQAVEEFNRALRATRIFNLKYSILLEGLKVGDLTIDAVLYDAIDSGDTKSAIARLLEKGAKPKRQVGPTVRKMIRLYDYFRDDLVAQKEAVFEQERPRSEIDATIMAIVKHKKQAEKED